MRIAEKTVELNFCAQVNALTGKKLIWFGLTQLQEARAGFDACTKLGGRLLLFQFKASNYTLVSKARRFYAKHDQMVELQKRCRAPRRVFYVFPLLGTTLELTKNPNLLSASWLLDVSRLPKPMPPSTKKDGTPRKDGTHYVDVWPGKATIRSEPFEVELISAEVLLAEPVTRTQRESRDQMPFEEFWGMRRFWGRAAVGAAVID